MCHLTCFLPYLYTLKAKYDELKVLYPGDYADYYYVMRAVGLVEFERDGELEFLHTGGNFPRRFGMTAEEYFEKAREEGIDYGIFF